LSKRKKKKSFNKNKIKKQEKRKKIVKQKLMYRQVILQARKMKDQAVPVTQVDTSNDLSLDEDVQFAHCDGVGNCCRNRAIPVEPADVWRILRNKAARERFGVELTADLFNLDGETKTPNGEEPPLYYWVDPNTNFLMCGVKRIKRDDGNEYCPFFVPKDSVAIDAVPTCLLEEDRLTYCKADPMIRCERETSGSKRRLERWTYVLDNDPCEMCPQADPNHRRETTVKAWLHSTNMVDRYRLTDGFFNFVEWAKLNLSEDQLVIAAMLIFDWHRFFMTSFNVDRATMVKDPGDTPVEEVLLSAKAILEQIRARDEIKAKETKSEKGSEAGEQGG
jgi:hypothetical protein